jgi:hypothetical protein
MTPLRGGDSEWARGIEASAAYWDRPPNGAVIFAAQDPSLGPFCPKGDPFCPKKPEKASFGSARLFALDAKDGTEIWRSGLVAEINDVRRRRFSYPFKKRDRPVSAEQSRRNLR